MSNVAYRLRMRVYTRVGRLLSRAAIALDDSSWRYERAFQERKTAEEKAFRKQLRALEIVMLRQISEADQDSAARGDVDPPVLHDDIAKGLALVFDAQCRQR